MKYSARRSMILILPVLALIAVGIIGCKGEPRSNQDNTKTESAVHAAETDDDHGKIEKAHKQEQHAHEDLDHDKHADHKEKHEGHEHEGEAHEEHERIVKLSPEEIEEFGIKLKTAAPGKLRPTLSLTGEVVLNPDKVVHVMPRVPGVVREVFKSVGDRVKKGDILAILDSAELAKAKSEFLEALNREDLAKTNFEREEKLWKEQVTPEKDFLKAQQLLREAVIRRERSERALHALGLSEEDLTGLPKQQHKDLTRYDMTSPLDGIVIKRHLVQGEVIAEGNGEPPFVVADLSSVRVNLAVYRKDLGIVREGQDVQISFGKGVPEVSGKIDYVSPVMDESTRTSRARVVLENKQGQFRPGMFVTGHVRTGERNVGIVVPKTAVLRLDGEDILFVKTEEGFKPRAIRTGRADGAGLEIVKGLNSGEVYVAERGFTLKAELKKSSFAGEGHSH
jgi:cobalt-zinc-cadmium efflux system membrane fusion protein